MPELGWLAWAVIVIALFAIAIAAPPLLAIVVGIALVILIVKLIFD